jgi:CHAD domain-containing protein
MGWGTSTAGELSKRLADERIQEWAHSLVKADVQAFEQARRRFVRRPTAERLHHVRTAARRLRSLLEDFAEIETVKRLKALKRIVEVTGEARDARVLRDALRATLDERERMGARPLLQHLRSQERTVTRVVRAKLRRFKLT